MGTPTYTPIASQTLTSSASSVTFSSIPTDGTYRDLVLVFTPIVSTAGNSALLRFNSDTGSNYTYIFMRGTGSVADSFAYSNQTSIGATPLGIDNTSTISIAHIMDFAATNKHKSIILRGNASSYGTSALAGRWASTSAITSISLTGNGVNFTSGSTFSLYGVAA